MIGMSVGPATKVPSARVQDRGQGSGLGKELRVGHLGGSGGLCTIREQGQVERASLGTVDELRRLHVGLDVAVRDAYGWQDLPLEHDFYEVETLPENDRVRYTIPPAARKELVKRLLAENHRRAAAESAAQAQTQPSAKKPSGRSRRKPPPSGPVLFESDAAE